MKLFPTTSYFYQDILALVNKWTLQFKDNNIEQEYQVKRWRPFTPLLLAEMVIAIFLFAIFILMDIRALPETKQYAITIRFGIIIPSLIFNLGFIYFFEASYLKITSKHPYLEYIIFGTGLLGMCYFSSPNEPDAVLYYAALMLAVAAAASLKTSFLQFLPTSAYFIAMMNLILYVKGMPFDTFINYNLLLVAITIVCGFGGYWRELVMRSNFILSKQLEENNQQLENRVHQRTVELATTKKKAIQALIQGQEMEQKRIARDLHDGLGVQIIGLNHLVEIYASKYHLNQEDYEKLSSEIDAVYDSLREISKNKLPSTLQKFGLAAAIETMCTNFSNQQAETLKLRLVLTPAFKNQVFDKQISIHYYRILQELLTNIKKHAAASECSINCDYKDKKVFLSVKDNGKGFIYNNKSQGLGLKNLNARIESLEGQIFITSSPNQGTEISITLPL